MNQSKTKIAFLTTQFSEVKSGPGRFTDYLKNLDFESLEIHFFSHQIEKETKFEHKVHIPNLALKIPLSSWFRAYYFNRKVQSTCRKIEIDFILTADFSMAMFLPSILLAKTFTMINDDNFLNIYSRDGNHQKLPLRTKLSRQLGFFLERYAARKSKIVVANSLYTKELIEKAYRISPSRVKLLYKAVDLSFFKQKNRVNRLPVRFLFIKNDWLRGGLDLILNAFSRLSFQDEILFTIAGIEDREKQRINQLIQESGFGGKVEIYGLVKKEQIMDMFHNSDVFINYSRKEALGVSCLEAMSAGLPVLSSDAGGLKEVMDFGKAGFMVSAENEAALSAELELMYQNPNLLGQKSEYAINHVQKFSVQNLKINLQNLFSEDL